MSSDGYRREPSSDSYDVVVVGSGLGGLSAAALLARAGMSTLVVERMDGIGGYAHAFRRGDYLFDPAIHWTAQGAPGELYDSVLSHVGVDEWEMIPLDHLYEAVFPDGLKVRLPLDLEGVIEVHQELFPKEADGIRRFFELARQGHVEIHKLPMMLSLRNLDEAADRFPVLFKLLRSTVGDVLDECISDPRARDVLSAAWPYSGSVPSRLAFVPFGQTVMNGLEGAYYSKGSFQAFAEALAKGVLRNEGEIVVGNGASSIDVEGGAVAGVTLDGGQQVRTPVVVSNADATKTFLELVGEDHLPRGLLRRLGRMTPSYSAFVLFCATRLDFVEMGLAHETFIYPEWDHESATAAAAEGRPAGVWINAPTPADPSLAPEGEHLAIISAVAAHDIGTPWEERAPAYQEELLDLVEGVVPGLRDSLTFLEAATPLTIERYGENRGGAMYGWEVTVQQSGTKRMPHHTPVEGLFLSGHWSLPGHGSTRVFASGVHTAQIVLRTSGLESEIPSFAAADLPAVD